VVREGPPKDAPVNKDILCKTAALSTAIYRWVGRLAVQTRRFTLPPGYPIPATASQGEARELLLLRTIVSNLLLTCTGLTRRACREIFGRL
jgi:hypothetical protein